MNGTRKKTKIVILGGGMASIAAAFSLTDRPELREKYDVTIYQMGWRIGGKGASGRNLERQQRVEEHGLHTWFGCYENAFSLMRKCYQELDRAPHTPLATWEDAFKPATHSVFSELYKDRWVEWPIEWPTNDSKPGDGTLLPTFWDMVHEFLAWLRELWQDLRQTRQDVFIKAKTRIPSQAKPAWWQRLIHKVASMLVTAEHIVWHMVLAVAHLLAKIRRLLPLRPRSIGFSRILCLALNRFKAWLWDEIAEPNLDDDRVRRFFTLVDLGTTVLCGILEDRLFERGFTSVDDCELKLWLRRHGAREFPTLSEGALVRALYDFPFAYAQGHIKEPNAAAGTIISIMLRMIFTYKGALTWRMQAGMGDTVFAPFYQVLKRRGVTFKFFHAVTNIGLDGNQANSIVTIEVAPQAPLTVQEYDPLVLVKGLPCWPSEPLWDQLKNGRELKKCGVNFEQAYNPLQAEPITLHKGEDFDIAILGISLAALPDICKEIIACQPKWQAMVDHVKTVMTQAFQVWINRDLQELGWSYPPDALLLTYIEPLSSWWNMNELIDKENWPAHYGLKDIAYWCGVLPDKPDETQAGATERARQQAIEYLKQHIEYIWPRVRRGPNNTFDWDVLIDPENRQGEARFEAQFWQANFQPTERYVQSLAGSTKYRLRTDESGYDNLFLAGDWIRIGSFDAGCIEAAVMSGLQASRAICGYPERIVGEKDPWL